MLSILVWGLEANQPALNSEPVLKRIEVIKYVVTISILLEWPNFKRLRVFARYSEYTGKLIVTMHAPRMFPSVQNFQISPRHVEIELGMVP